jgi:AcrR family transcriptional regulator
MGIIERKEREKEQRRQDIIDAAEKVFFSKGVVESTMDDVAEEAELSKGTLYLYFQSKEELYFAITKRGLDILTDMFKKAAKKEQLGIDKIHAIGKAYYAFSKKYPDYFKALIYFDSQTWDFDETSPMAMACEQQGLIALGFCADAIREGIEDGSIRSDIDPLKVSVILWGQTSGILQLIHLKGKDIQQRHDTFRFKDLDDIVLSSFEFIRHSLETKK